MDDLNQLALLFPCPACKAEAGEWCVTYRPTVREPGRRSPWLHQPRIGPLQDARHEGWKAGAAMAYDSAAYTLTQRREGAAWTIRDGVPLVAPEVIAWLQRRASRG